MIKLLCSSETHLHIFHCAENPICHPSFTTSILTDEPLHLIVITERGAIFSVNIFMKSLRKVLKCSPDDHSNILMVAWGTSGWAVCSWGGFPQSNLSKLKGFKWECSLVNNIWAACLFVLGEGWWGGGGGVLEALIIGIYACMCDCMHVLLDNRPKHPKLSLLLLFSKIPALFLHHLIFPALHSCEKKHSAERDICSLRECPNYSWPFNHSGFGLCGICGVSHKCV